MAKNNYAYTGATPVAVGDAVVVVDEDEKEHKAKVHTVLASQFIAAIPKQGHKFYFYRDSGETWWLQASETS